MKPKYIIVIFALLVLILSASPAHAGGIVTVCDEAHLLAALAGGGTVTFACSGTITLTAEIAITVDTTVDGSGQDVTISGNNAVRVFTVAQGLTLFLNDLTIANGNNNYGGGIYNNGTVTVNHSTFVGSNAVRGGGIYSVSTLVINNSTFSQNESMDLGGGIYSEGSLYADSSIFSDNRAFAGGAIYKNGNAATIIKCIFNDNATDDKFSPGGPGGGIVNYLGTLNLNDTIFSGNNGEGSGGAIYNHDTLIVINNTFSDNVADNGRGTVAGGILNDGLATISNSTFNDNKVGGSLRASGGGIYNRGIIHVQESTFSGNTARSGSDASGGAIANYGGELTVSNSTFFDNSTTNGAIFAMPSSVFTARSDSHSEGGAIFSGAFAGNAVLIVTNTTLAGNIAEANGTAGLGGGIYIYASTATLKNTIVANNRPGGNCAGLITDGGGNLSYPDSTCPGGNGDPVLGPLQDNGGPTWTMALGWGSAAIDAGIDAICAAEPVNNLDQRGVVRPQGSHCDIGAVEQEPFPVLPPRLWLPVIQSH